MVKTKHWCCKQSAFQMIPDQSHLTQKDASNPISSLQITGTEYTFHAIAVTTITLFGLFCLHSDSHSTCHQTPVNGLTTTKFSQCSARLRKYLFKLWENHETDMAFHDFHITEVSKTQKYEAEKDTSHLTVGSEDRKTPKKKKKKREKKREKEGGGDRGWGWGVGLGARRSSLSIRESQRKKVFLMAVFPITPPAAPISYPAKSTL